MDDEMRDRRQQSDDGRPRQRATTDGSPPNSMPESAIDLPTSVGLGMANPEREMNAGLSSNSATEETSTIESLTTSLERGSAALQPNASMERTSSPLPGSSSSNSGQLSALGANLTQLERDVLAKASSASVDGIKRPGATAVNAATGSLMSMERDVAAKQGTSADKARQPGVEHVTGMTHSLSRLEQDLLAKTSGLSSDQRIRPESLTNAATSLTTLEQDVATKRQEGQKRTIATQPGAVGVYGLARLEQDVLAKGSVRRGGGGGGGGGNYPGAARVDGASSLAALENDIAAKSASHGNSVAGSPIDAYALTRLEQDVHAKASVGLGQRSGLSQPGAVSFGGSSGRGPSSADVVSNAQNTRDGSPSVHAPPQSMDVSGLGQLERDVLMKTSLALPTKPASRPGVTSINGAPSLAALERDIAAKYRPAPDSLSGEKIVSDAPRRGHSDGTESLERLESDVLLKATAGSGRQAEWPGSITAGSIKPAAVSLAALERDVVSKASARSGAGICSPGASNISENQSPSIGGSSVQSDFRAGSVASALSQLEQDALLKGSRPREAGTSSTVTLSELEADVQTKQMGGNVGSRPINEQDIRRVVSPFRVPPGNDLFMLEDQVLIKSQASSVADGYSASTTASEAPPISRIGQTGMLLSMRNLEDDVLVKSTNRQQVRPDPQSRETQESQVQSTTTPSDVAPEASLYQNTGYGDHVDADDQTAGIEAFVADNVVDATGVTVIASEEDEEKRQRTKQQLKLCVIGLILIIIVVAIIISVAVAMGRKAEKKNATLISSDAPTMAPTMSPTSSNFAALIQDLAFISGEQPFLDRESPQYLAVEWLIDEDTYDSALSVENPDFMQRYALAVVYFSLGGPLWRICGKDDASCSSDSNINNWLSSTDVCTWYGLTCGAGGFLEKFYFRAAAGTEETEKDLTVLDGELPNEITLLNRLTDFVADGFKLQGSISDVFSKCSNLQTLILSNNNITAEIPENIADVNPQLQTIILSANQMSGTLPASIGQLTSLISLQLNGNAFSGPVDTAIFALTTALQRLELQGNSQLSGLFPESVYALTSLEILRVDDTGMSGTMRSDIIQMSNLLELDMSGSQMSGTLPSELYRLGNITTLKLSQASFTGSLSDDIRLLNQTLEYAYFDDNDFTGSLPVDALGALTNLKELQLFGNELSGAITSTSDLCSLVFAGQIDFVRTDCIISCQCCAKCVD